MIYINNRSDMWSIITVLLGKEQFNLTTIKIIKKDLLKYIITWIYPCSYIDMLGSKAIDQIS